LKFAGVLAHCRNENSIANLQRTQIEWFEQLGQCHAMNLPTIAFDCALSNCPKTFAAGCNQHCNTPLAADFGLAFHSGSAIQ
jgi:hypothetical protein